eukprot:scaffold79049_cov30-Tisochrysis_lutea.AAC.1
MGEPSIKYKLSLRGERVGEGEGGGGLGARTATILSPEVCRLSSQSSSASRRVALNLEMFFPSTASY